MIEEINKLIEISEVLEDNTYNIQLGRMKKTLEKKEFLVSIMGQFSVGKSRLINNLMEKEILPVHITETTAIITFIKYGEEDRVEIIYKNGEKGFISITESLELWQNGEKELLEDIEIIVIYIKSELLSTGLVIVDTPGVNTIINEHIALAAEIMEKSDRIIYVMGKPLSDMDLDFIEKIRKSGLAIMFVRTHMDNLKSTEEDIDSSIKKEKELLQSWSSDKIFFVSNEKNNAFYSCILELKDYLEKKLTLNIQQAIEETCKSKALFIADKYQKELIKKEDMIQQMLDGDKKNYYEKKQDLEKILSDLKNILLRNEKKVKKKIVKVKEEAEEDLQYVQKKAEKELTDKINQADFGTQSKKYANLIKKIVYKNYDIIKDTYIAPYNRLLGENKESICKDLSAYNLGIDFEEYIPSDIETSSNKMAEIDDKIEALKSIRDICKENIDDLESQKCKNMEKREEMEEVQKQLEEEMEEIQEQLNEYLVYKPEYKITPATHNVENIMGMVGNMLDWVTLLLPGKAYVSVGGKGIKMVENVASKIPKARKAIPVLKKAEKFLKKSRKAKKVVDRIDKGADFAKVVKGIKDNISVGNKKEKSKMEELQAIAEKKTGFSKVLDLLTFEHYFRNIGKRFDKKEVKEIDREYEKEFYRKKQEIQQKMRQSIKKEMEKRNKIFDIDDQIQKIKTEEEIKKRKKKAAEKEIKELEIEKNAEKQRKIINVMQKHYIDTGLSAMDTIYNSLSQDLRQRMEQCVENYIAVCNIEIKDKIQAKEQEIKELDCLFDSSSRQEIEEKLSDLKEYSKYLQNMGQVI